MMSVGDKLQPILSEFEKLKDEQIVRIQYRENLYYLTMVVAGGLIAAAFGDIDLDRALIVLPIVLFIILTVYTNNDKKITAIGDYFAEHLAERVRSSLQNSDDYFSWETYHKNNRGRFFRKLRHLISKLLLFIGAPMIALVFFLEEAAGTFSILDKTLLVIGVLCTLWNALDVFANADL